VLCASGVVWKSVDEEDGGEEGASFYTGALFKGGALFVGLVFVV